TSHSMLTMLNDMLDIGEIEVRTSRLSIEAVDIYKLGQQVSQSMVESLRQQGLELLYFFAPDSPRCIDTDYRRLRQILRNLLDNAIKFTNSGYVSFTIDAVTKAAMADIKTTRTGAVGKEHTPSKSPETTPGTLQMSTATIRTTHDPVRSTLRDRGR